MTQNRLLPAADDLPISAGRIDMPDGGSAPGAD
jgi:hypothetical protein